MEEGGSNGGEGHNAWKAMHWMDALKRLCMRMHVLLLLERVTHRIHALRVRLVG